MFSLLRQRLVSKFILAVGIPLLLCTSVWSYLNIRYQKKMVMEYIVAGGDRLGNTIRLCAHFAMMHNSRDDITQIINDAARQPGIENIRIYNKEGRIQFSNSREEVDRTTNIKAEACDVCHRTQPPLTELRLEQKTRIFRSPKGYRLLGIISPLYNEQGCSTDACHVHLKDQKVLGALDLVVSLEEADKEILSSEKGMMGLAVFGFLISSSIMLAVVLRFVSRPIRRLIQGTRLIGQGNYDSRVVLDQADEMTQLAEAVNQMAMDISRKQAALNKKMAEYQDLFENVPCMISVQDREYRFTRFNRLITEKFGSSSLGEYCFKVYKGRDGKCENCPVEKTFLDGNPHSSEETGVNRDGSVVYWLVMTSPVRDENGEIVAAMEMMLDLTDIKRLKLELEESVKKYYDIFNNIPNPVFILDINTLDILDVNNSVTSTYDYKRSEITGHPFLDLFSGDEREGYAYKMMTSSVIHKARQIHKSGRVLFVTIRISTSEYLGRKVFFVTTGDITKRLEAEQQLIQAGKMATLGEMATGIAHELNQPLSVIKTAASFFMQKIARNEPIQEKILYPMLEKIDSNVDRASKIITHMRQFARKSDITLEKVHLNQVLEKSAEIFSQQLKLMDVEVKWDLCPSLPFVMADAGRLEQVFINFLLNARDAIEDRWGGRPALKGDKFISLKTYATDDRVVVEVGDSGKGVQREVAEKIFEPFFTTKDVGKGTGLGLSISYGIVKECGGEILLDAEYEGGACFVVSFPRPVEVA